MIKRIILIMCILGTISLGFANKLALKDGLEIMASQTNYNDKSSSISATINGHVLSVVFTENLGQVAIAVTYADGGTVDTSTIQTPSGANIYIAGTGSFVVRFTLRDGDEYWGEFEISE